ncbi:hypothetical protein K0U83_10815 [bacterium]|nr:hypothetical protein [bacterium]
MGEAPGVARATGAEARQAAREVGAVVDGARWSLPAMVPGWGWRLSYVPRCWFLTRLDAEDVEGGSVATVESANGACAWQLVGAPAWSEADSLADGQAAALAAARLAGLFAPRPVTGDGDPPALPAVTAQDGSAVVPQSPLDALLALLSRVSGGPLDHETQTAAGAFLRAVVAEARAPRHTIAAVGEQGGSVTTDPPGSTFLDDEDDAIPPSSVPFSPLLSACIEIARAVSRGVKAGASDYGALVREALHGVALEDFLDEFKRFDGGRPMRFLGVTGVPHEETRSAERAAAEARLEAEAAERRAAQAERERDDARAELAALREGVDGLRTWATGAKGAAR